MNLSSSEKWRVPAGGHRRLRHAPWRGLDRNRLTSLALSDWIGAGSAILLTGATGCGKTWLACALGQYACRQGRSVRYLRIPRLAEELRTCQAAGSYARWLAQSAVTITGIRSYEPGTEKLKRGCWNKPG